MTEKTCGNCESWRTVGIERGYCILDNSLEDGCAKLHLRDDAACNKHTDAPLPLEQRYQQLAEITRDLWQFIADRAPNMPQSIYILGKTAEQLDKLGVMVDD